MIKLVKSLYAKANRFLKAKRSRYEELKKSTPFILKLIVNLKSRAQISLIERKKKFARRMPSQFVQ